MQKAKYLMKKGFGPNYFPIQKIKNPVYINDKKVWQKNPRFYLRLPHSFYTCCLFVVEQGQFQCFCNF